MKNSLTRRALLRNTSGAMLGAAPARAQVTGLIPGGAGFGFQNSTPDVVSSNAVPGSGGPRAIQLGLKIIF